MVPAKVCTVCGAPSERIVEQSEEYRAARAALQAGDPESFTEWTAGGRRGAGLGSGGGASSLITNGKVSAAGTTIGWTDCGHDSWRNGVVLDPFAGSGTTLMVATGHGRDAIGVDIDARNADLALDRVGPLLLTVEHLADEVAS